MKQKYFLIAIPLMLIFSLFQNCGSGFSTVDMSSLSNDQASVEPETEVPVLPEDPIPLAKQKHIFSLKSQEQISLPKDEQGSTPNLPNIGEFIDLPGTNGKMEFTRITNESTRSNRAHLYARRSSIDPFHKYILTYDYLYHLDTVKEFKKVPFGYEYVVSQTEEDTFYGYRGNKFEKWNAVTDEFILVYTAPSGMSNYTIGGNEGGMSWDDQFIALCWDKNSGKQITIVNTKTGNAEASTHSSDVDSDDKLNWVDVSPKGTYVLVGMGQKVYRYNTQLQNKTRLNTRSGGNAHGDTLYDKAGNEVFAQEGNFNNGQISYVTLESNTLNQMNLVDVSSQKNVDYPNSASHISGQARNVQGLLFISLQDTSGMFNMFSAFLEPDQTSVYSMGHTYSKGNNYASEAKASISNSGRFVVWTSDWMQGGGQYEFLARIKN